MAERIVINTDPLMALMRMKALDLPAELYLVFLAPTEVRQELDAGARAGPPPVHSDGATASSATTARSRTWLRVARGDAGAGAT
jgi:hypothetical protein